MKRIVAITFLLFIFLCFSCKDNGTNSSVIYTLTTANNTVGTMTLYAYDDNSYTIKSDSYENFANGSWLRPRLKSWCK